MKAKSAIVIAGPGQASANGVVLKVIAVEKDGQEMDVVAVVAVILITNACFNPGLRQVFKITKF